MELICRISDCLYGIQVQSSINSSGFSGQYSEYGFCGVLFCREFVEGISKNVKPESSEKIRDPGRTNTSVQRMEFWGRQISIFTKGLKYRVELIARITRQTVLLPSPRADQRNVTGEEKGRTHRPISDASDPHYIRRQRHGRTFHREIFAVSANGSLPLVITLYAGPDLKADDASTVTKRRSSIQMRAREKERVRHGASDGERRPSGRLRCFGRCGVSAPLNRDTGALLT
ncbi:unnamed protein product [Nesidiocoris tenuis]|uniref:Uncharacterized protein n=1 Tax=Nesidiocoris tenuis TaxID=355587 RepID=A0A6H5G1U3_9HEMI|nr:unnamed protein product [Nesidiocoris tenuis]